VNYDLMTLVCHGNGYLAGKRWSKQPSGFNTQHSDFHFVRPREDGGPDEEFATSSKGWLASIAAAGAQGLRIDYGPDAEDRNRVWMMNGVVEAAEVLYPGNESEFWIRYLGFPDAPPLVPAFTPFPRLALRGAFHTPSEIGVWLREVIAWPSVYIRDSLRRAQAIHAQRSFLPPAKTWKYMHRLQVRRPTEKVSPPDLSALEVDLRRALLDILDFTTRANAGFIDNFSGALDILDGRAAPTRTDFAPDGVVPPVAVRLVSACSNAWVFGGMMSWNDGPYNPPSDPGAAQAMEDEYNRVSAALYLAITRVLLDWFKTGSPDDYPLSIPEAEMIARQLVSEFDREFPSWGRIRE
jgi:hypothetical protein